MEEQEKLFIELYEILDDNKENNLLDNYKKAEKIIIEHSKYEYNFLLREFSCFIKTILKDYSSEEDILVNRCISEKEIVYSDYYTKDAIKYLNEFLVNNCLGIIKYNKVIVWNENITVRDLIQSYCNSLNSLRELTIPKNDLNVEMTLNRKRNGGQNGK